MATGAIKQAAKKFVEYWTLSRPGSEKSGCQQYWNMLLGELLGMTDLASGIRYEVPVQVSAAPGAKHQALCTKFLDAWIPSTRVLIEQKSRGVKLDAPQAGHDGMTPFEQAKFYDDHRAFDEKARWIITCNFDEIWIYDQTKPLDPPEKIALGNLPKELHRLSFLVNAGVKKVEHRELEISVQAGKIVGTLYDALLKQYAEPESAETLKALNKLCVRLVFCFYAEDADIFNKNLFRKLVAATPADRLRRTLVTLFENLNTPLDERDKYLESEIAAFPYTNGGLFRDATEDEIPPLTEDIRQLLISSSDFDWSGIDTTIFGALFESTLNPDTRRAGGMVYTSSENIHKLIDPLFLDDLEKQFGEIVSPTSGDEARTTSSPRSQKERTKRLLALQDHIASLTFLDPACGSGNFLTETYTSLRRLENKIITTLQAGQSELDLGLRVKVSINQFHGIEINDFAVTVAMTAMWISEAKMLRETADILHRTPDFLPLKSYNGIVEGNALRMDWNAVKLASSGNVGVEVTPINQFVDFRSAKDHLVELKRTHANVENREGTRFRFTNQVMKALSDKARDQSVGKSAHWAAVGNIERLCKASVALWNEKPRNGSTDILHYAKHGAAFTFQGKGYVAKITSKAYPGENGVVTYSVEAISVENNLARGITDAISKKQHLDPSDENRILNFAKTVKGVFTPYSYIIGNPPFVGHQYRSKEQVADMDAVFSDIADTNYGKLDYVCAWYKKSMEVMKGSPTCGAFVSTNSIVQGESVAAMWKPLFEKGLVIDFAWRTFRWDNESFDKAHVHCVIIGYHIGDLAAKVTQRGRKVIFDGDKSAEAKNINGYLCEAANVFIQNRGGVFYSWLPKMSKGSQPTDGGNLILSPAEREEIILSHPEAAAFILQYISAEDFINNKLRYCLWLKGVAPNLYRAIPEVRERLEAVAEMRRKSPTKSVQRDAETPMLFTQIRQPTTNYLVVPEVSSERRWYVPIGFVQPNVIASNMLYIVPDASLFMFGVLISSVHMAWMRTVCGRLKSDYRYTPAVYNNFPWPSFVKASEGKPEASVRAEIEQAAQGILDARALYPGSSLADLYDPLTMPPELRKAHAANDAAVMKAYGFPLDLSEPEIVSRLFEMYAKLTNGRGDSSASTGCICAF